MQNSKQTDRWRRPRPAAKPARMENDMEINKTLSKAGCWKMVNAIQNGKTPEEIRERCRIAESWLMANEIIDNEEYDELMMTVAYLRRESYHLA